MNRLIICLLCVLFIACGKDGGNTDEPAGSSKKGFGHSREWPDGSPMELPAGITIGGPIKGYSVFTTEFCDNKTEEDAVGIGDLVRVCIPFKNSRNESVTVVIPQGWIMVSQKGSVTGEFLRIQSGIVVRKATIVVPPNSFCYQPLFLFCVNSGWQASAPDFTYDPGPITNDRDMQQLFELLNRKRLPDRDVNFNAQLQSAVWDASEGKPVNKSSMDAINALPDL